MSYLPASTKHTHRVSTARSGTIQRGFTDPVDAAQRVFRKLLLAMSSPFTEQSVETSLPAAGNLCLSAYAIALTLLDHSTRVMLTPPHHNEEIEASLKFHCQTPVIDQLNQADFVFCNEKNRPRLLSLRPGNSRYPDQSATLIVQCERFSEGQTWRAEGPGIESEKKMMCSAFDSQLLQELQTQYHQYREQSLGIDLIFCTDNRFFCLPRSTRIQAEVS